MSKFIRDERRYDAVLFAVGLFVISSLLAARLWASGFRHFDPDELQHLHIAWLISGGLLPYRDFFEHHTPLLHIILQPLFIFIKPADNIVFAIAAIFIGRAMSWALTVVIVSLSFILGTIWRGWQIGLAGAIILLNIRMFLEKAIEIRPDMLSLTFWIAHLCLVMYVIRAQAQNRWLTRTSSFLSGLLLGAAVMATQKMLFVLPGISAVMLLYLFQMYQRHKAGEGILNVILQLFGFLIPIIIILFYFFTIGAGWEFIRMNFLYNVSYGKSFLHYVNSERLLVQNPIVIALFVIGFTVTLAQVFRKMSLLRGDFVLIINMVGLIVGLWIIPSPQRQYYMIFLPLVALFSAAGLHDLLMLLSNQGYGNIKAVECRTGGRSGTRSMLACGLMAIVLAAIILNGNVRQLFVDLKVPNVTQIREITYVIENTKPSDIIMDGWSGVGVFRPHAFYTWMTPEATRRNMPAGEVDNMFRELKSCAVTPALVNLDEDLRELSTDITMFLEQNYTPTGVGEIYARNSAVPCG
jgi:hypothetical protein